ncbi:MAG: SH3 domain-containing protein [Prochlorotrichaceae cyanobacterium]
MFSNLAKIFAGVVLAFSLLAIGGITIARYLVEEFTAPPPKPIFAEEQAPPPSPAVQPTVTSGAAIVASPATPTPSPKPTPSRPNGKAARVTWPEGLVIRNAPDGNPSGGVDYNTEVVILETTADGNWQKIWFNNQEGWVKAGNVEMLP